MQRPPVTLISIFFEGMAATPFQQRGQRQTALLLDRCTWSNSAVSFFYLSLSGR